MNIFYLDPDPKVCAEMHLDKHVVKMIIEYAQLIHTKTLTTWLVLLGLFAIHVAI